MPASRNALRALLFLACSLVLVPALPGCSAAAPPGVLAIEEIPVTLPFFDIEGRPRVREPRPDERFPAMRALLSRSRYWLEDGHLDVVVRLDPVTAGHALEGTGMRGRVRDEAGNLVSEFSFQPPSENFVFYPSLGDSPPGYYDFELNWIGPDGDRLDVFEAVFRVARFREAPAAAGTVSISIPNETGVAGRGIPFTVGVPFPRGALDDPARLRLLSGPGGPEIPVQVTERGRWSKFGSVKWVHLDFPVDLEGGPRELVLEYGGGAARPAREAIPVSETGAFPAVDAGRLRLGNGLWFDASGNGDYTKVLEARALEGAFVEHEDGRVYRPGREDRFEVEEAGPEKVVLRREGWYLEEETGRRFCRYITRYFIRHDSPLLRILHTWIFTGDGNRDRVAGMGWEFPLAEGAAPGGFLSSFEDTGRWLEGDSLVQWDYEHFTLLEGARARSFPSGRAPGVASARVGGARLFFGARDFWQNYPSELEFRDGSLWFHNWPRHNPPARYTFEGRPVMHPGAPALPSATRHDHYEPGRLTRSEWKLNIIQARFAHEGEALDFRLPDQVAENPIWSRVGRDIGSESEWELGDPESVNAQGISRTEEIWLYLAPAGSDDSAGVAVISGLDGHALRAVVDPAWVASSGAFYEMRHQDRENFPEEERTFEQMALAPGRWQERQGLYGMWIHGLISIWDEGLGELARREPILYRGFRKRHHGWPYSWAPYARSGDRRLLRLADAYTRKLVDVGYRHYGSPEVEQTVSGRASHFSHRAIGLIQRSTLPWATRSATTRCYEAQVDFLLDAWHLAGYHRARDVFLEWAEATRVEESRWARGLIYFGNNRAAHTILKSYVEAWEETFDPWFLVAAHAISEGHLDDWRTRREGGVMETGHTWSSGDRDFLRFTGDEGDFLRYFLAHADSWGGHRLTGWPAIGTPSVEPNAFAWLLTGDDYYLGRVAHFLDIIKAATWEGTEPSFFTGACTRTITSLHMFSGWALQYFGAALHAVEKSGRRPDPVSDSFELLAPDPVIALRKEAGAALPFMLQATTRGRVAGSSRYEVVSADGRVVLGGPWNHGETVSLEIPAGEPAGDYYLRLSGASSLVVPVSERAAFPEVIVSEPGVEVTLGQHASQAWFFVPDGVSTFEVEIPLFNGLPIRRMTIWNPEGDRAWDLNYRQGSRPGEETVKAVVEVPPGQDGRHWRLTLPGNQARFRMDERIPPFYSVHRSAWFMPEGSDFRR